MPGTPGRPGIDGVVGIKGEHGDKGSPGFPGLPGMEGKPGRPGISGLKGDQGLPGAPGLPGSIGYEGAKGDIGLPGLPVNISSFTIIHILLIIYRYYIRNYYDSKFVDDANLNCELYITQYINIFNICNHVQLGKERRTRASFGKRTER